MQNAPTLEQLVQLYQQHAVMMAEIQNVYVALAIIAFLTLFFMACMFGAAAWSVRQVNKRTEGLETKFTLLIDVLLRQAEREIQMRKVQIDAENVEVKEAGAA